MFNTLFKIMPLPFFFTDVAGLVLGQVAFIFFVSQRVAGYQHNRATACFFLNFAAQHISSQHTVTIVAFNNFNLVEAVFFFVEVVKVINQFRQQGDDFFFRNEAEVAAGRNAQYAAADCGAFMPLLFNGVVQVCAKVTRCAAELGGKCADLRGG